MAHEAADAVKDERPFAGVHILATAILCAGGSSADELELARRILVRDPKEDEPRESESIAGAFNRHMDAAIESVSASRREPTRAARRARLAQDLERERLVLVDRAAIAELIAVVAELREELKEHQVEEFGAELAGGDTIEELAGSRSTPFETPATCYLEHNPGADRGDYADPRLND